MKTENIKKDNIETRDFNSIIEIREEGEKRTVSGVAAVFNTRAEIWEGFFEEIARGAFDDSMNDDVRALFNHDRNMILARSRSGSGTLKLSTGPDGLRYEFEAPNTTAGNDLLENIRLGNIDQSSFAFTVKESKIIEHDDGTLTRQILKVGRLYDVSPVTYPAYKETTVKIARDELSAYQESKKDEKLEKRRAKIEKKKKYIEITDKIRNHRNQKI